MDWMIQILILSTKKNNKIYYGPSEGINNDNNNENGYNNLSIHFNQEKHHIKNRNK